MGPQTLEHIMHFFPLHKQAKTELWLQAKTLVEKLWGTKANMEKRDNFVIT